MELKIIMEAVRRMRKYQKKRENSYEWKEGKLAAEKAVDLLIAEWEQTEFHKHQKTLF